MKQKIYEEYFDPDEKTAGFLKAVISEHTKIYNFVYDRLKEFGTSYTIKDCKRAVKEKVTSSQITNYIMGILINEIRYLHKRFATNSAVKKSTSGLNYLTYAHIVSGNSLFKGSPIDIYGKFTAGEYTIPVKESLDVPNNTSVYVNISYSSLYNKFRLSVFLK